MQAKIRQRKTVTHFRCPRCKKVAGNFSYVEQRDIHLTCFFCGTKHKLITDFQIRRLKHQNVFCLFYGGWLEEEIKYIEANFNTDCTQDEWSFFKGRFLFSAWQRNEVERVIFANDIKTLVAKVKNLCKPNP